MAGAQNEKTPQIRNQMNGYADILKGMLHERGIVPWEKYVKETKERD